MVFSGIVPDGGNVVIHSGSHKNKQQGGSSYNLTGSGHMRPNAPATSGLIGVGRPPVASSGQTSTGAELQELERLKRKLRDQQTRLVSHMSSNSSSNNAAGSSSATPSRHNTPRSLPSITRTPNSTGPPLGGRSTPQHPRPPSSGGSPGINTGSPAIMPRPPSASSVPAMPRVAASQVRLASLLSPSVAPMDTPRFSRHAIDDDEEVSSLLRGIRLSEERMEQRKQIMTLDWARHPEEPRSPSQLAGLSMSDAGDADDLPPMVQVDMQDIGTVSMQGVLSSWASHRDGSVLNAQTILRRDRDEFLTGPPSGQQADKVDTMVLSACPLFRIADSLNVAAVGQPSIVGIRTLLNELRFQGKPRCVWINVREESFIYINGFSHTLCTSHPPFDNVRQRGIRRERLEAVESRLRDDILEEATRHEGNLALHYADHGKAVWEAIGGARDVSTPVEVFTELVPNIVYHRLPIGPKSSPPVETFDELIEIALRHPNDVIMFNCHSGRGRSTTAMMVVGLLRSYTHSNTFTADDLKKYSTANLGASKYRGLRRLLALFPEGYGYEERIAYIGGTCGGVVGMLRDKIDQLLESTVTEVFQRGLALLERYCTLVALAAYFDERFGSGNRRVAEVVKTDMSFATWLERHGEVRTVLQDVSDLIEANVARDSIVGPDVLGDEMMQLVANRKGVVLGPHMVLQDVGERESAALSHVPAVDGVSRLRALGPRIRIYSASATTPESIAGLTMYLGDREKGTAEEPHKIHWVNIGIEPIVFLHQHPYALHDFADGKDQAMRGVSSERLAAMEDRLKQDVLAEARANEKNAVLVHHGNDGRFLNVTFEDVTAAKDMVHVASQGSRCRVRFIRFPTPPHGHLPTYSEIHNFMVLCESMLCSGDASIVLANRSGAGHASLMMCVAALVQLRMEGSLSSCATAEHVYGALSGADGPVTVEEMESILRDAGRLEDYMAADDIEDDDDLKLSLATKFMQIIGNRVLIDVVDTLVGLAGKGSAWNCKHAVRAFEKKAQSTENHSLRAQLMQRAVLNVKKYCLLLVVAAYLEEVGLAFTPRFETWLESREELASRFNTMHLHPEETVKRIHYFHIPTKKLSVVGSASAAGQALLEGHIHNRKGNIMTPNHGLKADHFPGCQRKDILPAVVGAPNMRKVKYVNVYGCGIPTVTGIQNVLALLGAVDNTSTAASFGPEHECLRPRHSLVRLLSQEQTEKAELMRELAMPGYMVWINLREEPIMFVHDRPFVFRDLQTPYVNVEITGIESQSIERIEERLRDDVLEEARECDGNVLLHDESRPCELCGVWEQVTEDSVRTIRSLYDGHRRSGARVEFHRIPVTDEMSPEHKDFDVLVETLLPHVREAMLQAATRRVSFVFNCQMGRGRTTTGMVVCVMMMLSVSREYRDRLLADALESESVTQRTSYGRGEYRCIASLVRALQDGRDAKATTDVAIDTCERMQNLRDAIEMFKKTVESPDTSEEARGRALHHGVHYLQRYFHLICFASYLGEAFDVKAVKIVGPSFAQWMAERAELNVMHDEAALE